jgi:hypothetical protein
MGKTRVEERRCSGSGMLGHEDVFQSHGFEVGSMVATSGGSGLICREPWRLGV